MIKPFFFIEEKRIKREAEIWNAVLSILNAGQSALLIFLIARLCGDSDAGVFSLAFSVAYLMIMVGNYGVRNYQSTDVVGQYNSRDYVLHRIVSCSGMLALSVIYVLMHNYDNKKTYVILLCCILKLIESVEDVVHGEYQRCGRLDIAGKCGTIRYIACFIAFLGTLILSEDMVLAFFVMDMVSIVVFVLLTFCTYPKLIHKIETKTGAWYKIFVTCFPLFISTFFNIYICNASKYSIDRYYSDEIQGYYGMLFMPVFVINLLCACIYRPKLVELAEYWNKGDVTQLRKYFGGQMILILAIGMVAMILSYAFGTQILSIFFGTDLNIFKNEFLVLLLGGTMTAVVDFCNNMITILRKQKIMIWIYGIISVLAFICTGPMVQRMMLMGASVSYCGLLCVQAVMMVVCFMVMCKKQVNESGI